MDIVNIHEAKTHLSKILEQVQTGKEFIIGKAGKPIAKLIPYQDILEPRKPGGSWEGKVWMSEDFDELPPEFLKLFYEDSE